MEKQKEKAPESIRELKLEEMEKISAAGEPTPPVRAEEKDR